MLEKFAGWLVGWMLASQAFPKEDAPLVSFGIIQGLRTMIEIILMLLTGLFMNLLWQGALVLIAFMPLRIYAGGYHARTPMQCAVKTWLLFFGILLLYRFAPGLLWVQILLLAITGLSLWKFAPVEHENKPLEKYEVIKYRKLAFGIYGAETVLFVLFRLLEAVGAARCIVLGMGMMLVVMWIGVGVNRRGNHHE